MTAATTQTTTTITQQQHNEPHDKAENPNAMGTNSERDKDRGTMNTVNSKKCHHMIALYYCYPPNAIPQHLLSHHAAFHKEICQSLNLGGRIRVSHEGINGVLSGTESDLREYEGRLRRELVMLTVACCADSNGIDGNNTNNGDDKISIELVQDNDENYAAKKPSEFNSNVNDKDTSSEWLDIKYCHLRNDVPMEKQLFDSISVKVTREVVSLFDFNSPSISNIHSNGGGGNKYNGRRCRQSRKKKRQQKKMQQQQMMKQEVSVEFDGEMKERKVGEREEELKHAPILVNETDQTAESTTEVAQSNSRDKKTEGNKSNNTSLTNTNNNELQSAAADGVGNAFTIQDWEKYTPAVHLSPHEWNDRLLQLSRQQNNMPEQKTQGGQSVEQSFSSSIDSQQNQQHQQQNHEKQNKEEEEAEAEDEAILLDARNIYETRVGHFAVPNLPTFFPNTRKFSSLPMALNTPEAAEALAGKQVFMYCTGGVRCERAGSYLRALSESNVGAWKGKERPKGIYQLRGGIQKYLENYGESTNSTVKEISAINDDGGASCVSLGIVESTTDNGDESSSSYCLYRGKNFVFDPRRTDPIIGNGITKPLPSVEERVSLVGQCVICSCPHDDYDNGNAPCENKEARCCRCRVLVLVCNDCRNRVRSWGEPEVVENDGDEKSNGVSCNGEFKMDLFCGQAGRECVDEGNIADNVETTRF